jgi:hypothetical protein
MTPPATIAPVRSSFRAIVRAVAPASASLDEAAWRSAEAIVDDALALRDASIRRQIVVFIRLLNVLCLLRYGRRLARLDAAKARRLFKKLERAPLLLLRRGLWGVRTLAYMGYYAQDAVQHSVGYTATADGWASAGTAADAWPSRGDAGRPEASTLTAGDGAPHA